MPKDEIEAKLRFFSWLVVAGAAILVVIVLFSLTALVYLSFSVNSSSNKVKDLTENNHATLCTFYADIERRRDAAQEYLEDNPRGIVNRSTGEVIVSAVELQRGIDAQTETLVALDKNLDC